MSNSSLVNYTKISPNKTSPRNHKIDTITIHCVVGQLSVERLGDVFAPRTRKASSNYGIGPDGRIGMYVEEKDRSWCSSSGVNDNRAITIEVASNTTHPYAITDAALKSLIKLCADICKRNGIKKLVWSNNKNDRVNHLNGVNMTCHRDFANKACPGQYIYEREGYIADEVNKILAPSQSAVQAPTQSTNAFKVKVIIPDLNYREGPGMNYRVKGQTGKGVFTIVETKNGWGKLKSCVGWIWLGNKNYCYRI